VLRDMPQQMLISVRRVVEALSRTVDEGLVDATPVHLVQQCPSCFEGSQDRGAPRPEAGGRIENASRGHRLLDGATAEALNHPALEYNEDDHERQAGDRRQGHDRIPIPMELAKERCHADGKRLRRRRLG
jgi:hypothetical protein